MADKSNRPIQGDFLRRLLFDATGIRVQSTIASAYLEIPPETLTRWFLGTRKPDDASLRTMSRVIFNESKREGEFNTFTKDFANSFEYLSNLDAKEATLLADIPGLAKEFLIEKGLLGTDGKPTEKSSASSFEAYRPDLKLPRSTGQIYHFTDSTIDIFGRDAEKAALEEFRDAGPGFRWWQIAGLGGQGKSRLAIDLVKKTRRLGSWHAGFLLQEDGDQALRAFAAASEAWVPRFNTLIVIDYVLARTDLIQRVIRNLADRSKEFTEFSVALLVLERQQWNCGGSAGARADWFCEVTGSAGGYDAAIESCIFLQGSFGSVLSLSALDTSSLLKIVVLIAKNGTRPVVPESNEITSKLERIDDMGRPLYAFLLGKALGEGELGVTTSATDLLDWVLLTDRKKRWLAAGFGEGVDPPGVGSVSPRLRGYEGVNPSMHLAVLATIIRQHKCDDLADYYDKLGWIERNRPTLRQAQAIADNHLTDDPDPWINGLQPDLLGEYFVLESIRKQKKFEILFDLSWVLSPLKTADFISRISRDFPKHEATRVLLNCSPQAKNSSAWRALDRVMPNIVTRLLSVDAPIPALPVKVLERLADEGNLNSMQSLANCYELGRGVERCVASALELRKKAARNGSARAMAHVGIFYSNGTSVEQNYRTAFNWFKKGARAGDSASMACLGACYLEGKGVQRDLKVGLSWLRKGAALGDGRAMAYLGGCYFNGIGVDKDAKAAYEWYRKGAEAGDTMSMDKLGSCLSTGSGTRQDISSAAKYFRRSAVKGYPTAMNHMGLFLTHGIGISKNVEEAVSWYEKAYALGDKEAAKALVVFRFLERHSEAPRKQKAILECTKPQHVVAHHPPVEEKLDWRNLGLSKTKRHMPMIAECIANEIDSRLTNGRKVVSAKKSQLSFYPGLEILDIATTKDKENNVKYLTLYVNEKFGLLVNGCTDRQVLLNEFELDLKNGEQQEDYLRFHCETVRQEGLPLIVAEPRSNVFQRFVSDDALEDELRSSASVIRNRQCEDGSLASLYEFTALRDHAMVLATVKLWRNGQIKIIGEKSIISDPRITAPVFDGPFRLGH